MTFTDKHVLVLGGTSGIGLAVAELAGEHGARVTVASSRPASLDRALAELPTAVTGEIADLTDPAATTALFDRVGALDHLVFTAGEALTLLTVEAMDLDAARAAFGLRYFGALNAVSLGAPHIRPGGSIVLTTGVAAERPGPGWSVASSICGAITSLTRALAVELAPLRVNAVSPGMVRSPLWAAIDEPTREQMYTDTAKGLPLGRVGDAREVAESYLYLMTATYATGSIVTIDGGHVLA
jgi:NAD(P)-dependent dehydrogenase (short-subunit alcohol dehydrogenase family)